VEFVAGASNLRSLCYGIPLQSLFDAKGMAGNIIHAIATTNAVVSGLIVVEALKLLAAGGDPAACKSTFLRQDLSSRRLLTPVACEPPSAGCSVCGTARLTLRLDTAATTLAELLARVLRGRLAMLEPCLRAGSFSYEEGEDLDASEVALNARWLHVALDALPGGGIRHETLVEVQDQSQALTLALLVVHQAEWDEEEHPEKFTLSGAVPLAKAEPPAAVVAGGNGGDGTAAAAPVPAPRQVEMREGEDGEVELIDSDEEEAAVPAAGAANGKRKAAGGDAAPEMRAGKRARAAGAGGEDVVEMLDG
jgi:ubiquitin-like 1-activating enzyme E1 B